MGCFLRLSGSLADHVIRLARTSHRCMIPFMVMKKRMKISKGGQVSIPAVVRHRWATATVVLEDLGDRIVIEPAPDDPIAAAEGALAAEFGGLNEARLRRIARADERASERRR
jgi:hypothetical protein